MCFILGHILRGIVMAASSTASLFWVGMMIIHSLFKPAPGINPLMVVRHVLPMLLLYIFALCH
jgi:hypothetical protein